MGYDLHIERQPPGGWTQWRAEHTPAALALKLKAAEAANNDERHDQISEQIRAALHREKAAVGLLITMHEWTKAVKETPGVRLATKDAQFKNPRTGDVLSIGRNPLDVEVHSITGEWHNAIRFRNGVAMFSGRAWEPGHPVGVAACRLAQATHATIRGDEGEIYPLQPGSRGRRSLRL